MNTTPPLENSLVTLLGGSGFVGSYVAQALLRRGARVRIVSRAPERAHRLKPLANLGQMQIARCDIRDERVLRAAITGADHVVNLVGAFGRDMNEVMGEAPGTVARIARDAEVKSLAHVSAIGADHDAISHYGKAKARGEQGVLDAFDSASILRPSVIFASDDHFINMFAQLIALAPVLPVFGPNALLQPVFADDVAEAIVCALSHPARHGGKIFELGGPEVMTMMQFNQKIAAAQARSPALLAIPNWISAVFASLPLTPMSRDQWKMLKAGNTASPDMPGLKQLGITPRPLSLFLDKWMVQYRKAGRFSLARG